MMFEAGGNSVATYFISTLGPLPANNSSVRSMFTLRVAHLSYASHTPAEYGRSAWSRLLCLSPIFNELRRKPFAEASQNWFIVLL